MESDEDTDSSMGTTRRKVLTGVGTTAVGGLFVGDRVVARGMGFDPFSDGLFTLGVASGDPHSDAVVLWTRLAPEPLNGDGGLSDQNIPVTWRVATDKRMRNVVNHGVVRARDEHAHTVHVDAQGLQPDTEYYYQFEARSTRSPVGRTKTAPAPGASVSEFDFAFVSCQHYPSGYYTVHQHLAEEDLDLAVHLGDYIYEGDSQGSFDRGHEPPNTLQSLSDYRIRHAQYNTDPNLQAARAAFPWVVTWDDHEVVNNYADEEYEGTPPEEFLERRANAYQAYWEHQPLRRSRLPDGPELPLYRRFTFGSLAEFNVLDTRQYRDDQTSSVEEAQNPERTILGDEQEQWLMDGLDGSTSRWNVLAQQVPFAATDENEDPDEQNFGAGDKWDGYRADRGRLLAFMTQHPDLNPVVITGDVHRNYVYDLKADFANPDSETVGTEYVGTSVSSFGDGSGQVTFGGTVNDPHQQFFNDNRGYVRCTLTPEQWRTDYRVVSTIEAQTASIDTLASFVTKSGTPGAQLIPVEDTFETDADSIESTFETDTEGWTLVGDPQQYQPTYHSNGGYISGVDGANGRTWYYRAPVKFLGNRSAFYDGTLSFDLRQSQTDSQYEHTADIILRGNDTSLVYDTGDSSTHPGTDWTTYTVTLNASAGWKHDLSDDPVTDEEMRSVMGDLAQLLIRGEYRAGDDTSDLDTVSMSVE